MSKLIPGKLYEIELIHYPFSDVKFFRCCSVGSIHGKRVDVPKDERVFVMHVRPDLYFIEFSMVLYMGELVSVQNEVLMEIK